MKVARVTNINQAMAELKEKGVWIFGTAAEGSIPMYKADLTGPAALVIGNEARGVSDEVGAVADVRLKLPMRGGAESLNAAVAAGIMMYELMR
jgi:23S rRNA (guanosine2251-2'-O)-methyltransferase